MPNYRRWFVPGGTYFFTANLLRRDSQLLIEHIDALRAAYGDAAKRQPFETVAICILPNHLHCIWTLPAGDSDFSGRWRRIKTGFSRRLPRANDLAPGRRTGERGVWQRRFWEHVITDLDDLAAHIAYIHRAIPSSTASLPRSTIGPIPRGTGGGARMVLTRRCDRCVPAMQKVHFGKPQYTLPCAPSRFRRLH